VELSQDYSGPTDLEATIEFEYSPRSPVKAKKKKPTITLALKPVDVTTEDEDCLEDSLDVPKAAATKPNKSKLTIPKPPTGMKEASPNVAFRNLSVVKRPKKEAAAESPLDEKSEEIVDAKVLEARRIARERVMLKLQQDKERLERLEQEKEERILQKIEENQSRVRELQDKTSDRVARYKEMLKEKDRAEKERFEREERAREEQRQLVQSEDYRKRMQRLKKDAARRKKEFEDRAEEQRRREEMQAQRKLHENRQRYDISTTFVPPAERGRRRMDSARMNEESEEVDDEYFAVSQSHRPDHHGPHNGSQLRGHASDNPDELFAAELQQSDWEREVFGAGPAAAPPRIEPSSKHLQAPRDSDSDEELLDEDLPARRMPPPVHPYSPALSPPKRAFADNSQGTLLQQPGAPPKPAEKPRHRPAGETAADVDERSFSASPRAQQPRAEEEDSSFSSDSADQNRRGDHAKKRSANQRQDQRAARGRQPVSVRRESPRESGKAPASGKRREKQEDDDSDFSDLTDVDAAPFSRSVSSRSGKPTLPAPAREEPTAPSIRKETVRKQLHVPLPSVDSKSAAPLRPNNFFAAETRTNDEARLQHPVLTRLRAADKLGGNSHSASNSPAAMPKKKKNAFRKLEPLAIPPFHPVPSFY
jgi:hypothetical protein